MKLKLIPDLATRIYIFKQNTLLKVSADGDSAEYVII